MTPLVMIGCPIRNREWILSQYLEHLYNLDYSKENIILCFIVNDSKDKSEEILLKWIKEHEAEYRWIYFSKIDLGQVEDQRTHDVRSKIYTTLSQLRNQLLADALASNCEYFYSIDSDILVPPDSLNKLIECKKDIIAAQIWNDSTKTFPNIMVNTNGVIRHYLSFPRNEVFRCDVTGAVYLISRRVLEAGVKYGYHHQGEDIAFCQEAKSKGFEIWANSSVQPKHIMSREQLPTIKKTES
jgi:GT2 family glycosyltransferase